MILRGAERADGAGLVAIEAACFGPAERFSTRQVRGLIDNPRARVIVAEQAGAIVGWAAALVRERAASRSGRVYSVAVDPACEGRGVGRGLTTAVLAALEDAGVRRVYLEVRVGNDRAIGLYRSLGFVQVRSLGDYYGPGADGLRMRREVSGGAGR
ncbi:MAG: N-acetyltransferase [Phycisphaerales bacterium]